MHSLLPKGAQTHPQLHASLKALHGTKVRLTLTNTSSTPTYVYRINMPKKGVLENSVFSVAVGSMGAGYRSGDGKSGGALSLNPSGGMYEGEFVKRPGPGPPDFDELAPGDELVDDIDLADWYGLPSSGVIRVWYEAFHKNPYVKGSIFDVVSNDVTITL